MNAGDRVDLRRALEQLRERGHALILSEGGPTLFGVLLAASSIDKLFLTVSPLLAGRDTSSRLGLVEAVELLPGDSRRVCARHAARPTASSSAYALR